MCLSWSLSKHHSPITPMPCVPFPCGQRTGWYFLHGCWDNQPHYEPKPRWRLRLKIYFIYLCRNIHINSWIRILFLNWQVGITQSRHSKCSSLMVKLSRWTSYWHIITFDFPWRLMFICYLWVFKKIGWCFGTPRSLTIVPTAIREGSDQPQYNPRRSRADGIKHWKIMLHKLKLMFKCK